MHFYRLTDEMPNGCTLHEEFHGTLADAHKTAKATFNNSILRSRARIDLHDINTDKASLVVILNGRLTDVIGEAKPLRTWGLTARGGLKELQAGE